MSPHREWLIQSDMYVSVYEKEIRKNPPSPSSEQGICGMGGYIIAVNNTNKSKRWKEWKWYTDGKGEVFNDRQYVINMMYEIVKELQ